MREQFIRGNHLTKTKERINTKNIKTREWMTKLAKEQTQANEQQATNKLKWAN